MIQKTKGEKIDQKSGINASSAKEQIIISSDTKQRLMNIKGNGKKKLLIIGKTGTGKSSLCNVIR